jgi:hypothetical protein
MRLAVLLVGVIFVAGLGCGVDLKPSQRAPADVAGTVSSMEATQPEAAPIDDAQPPEGNAGTEATEPPADSVGTEENTESNVVQEKAQAGVGKQGRYEGEGLIVTPIKAYFGARQQIVFLQVENNLKTFKALHDRLPKDMAEFQAEILEPSQLQLPELPAGERYVYDAKKGELMVERPR